MNTNKPNKFNPSGNPKHQPIPVAPGKSAGQNGNHKDKAAVGEPTQTIPEPAKKIPAPNNR